MTSEARSQPLKATHFPHDADAGICGIGPTLEKAFEQAALAMIGVITDPANVNPAESIIMECAAPNIELLLVDWLNALIFEMTTRGMIFGDFEVHIEDLRLNGIARGEAISVERHNPAVEIKGATLTELCVREDRPGEWRAQCVVDV